MRKKWLINVSEEPDMINTILDNGRSLRQLIIGTFMNMNAGHTYSAANTTNRKSNRFKGLDENSAVCCNQLSWFADNDKNGCFSSFSSGFQKILSGSDVELPRQA